MTNVLLLIWDACRYDTANQFAPNLQELKEENVTFENAVAPADYSLPSHVSIFSGKYPHEHGCFGPDDYIGGTNVPLVSELNKREYDTYGVSANQFAGPEYGFDDPFDEFYNTYPTPGTSNSLNITELMKQTNINSTVRRYAYYLFTAIRHDYPVKSVRNLASSYIRYNNRFRYLHNKHPIFQPNNLYRYSPEENTSNILKIIRNYSPSDNQFFIFSNYIDPHRPYVPPKKFQRQVLGKTLSFLELVDLNENVAHPWKFHTHLSGRANAEADIETVRDLYRAEVKSVDSHLKTIVDELKEQRLLEDTLIIVTADHGENLGEVDTRGERRMGHKESFSENLLHVPLVMIHPELGDQNICEPVSLNSLYDLILDEKETINGLSQIKQHFGTDSDPVIVECPANQARPDAAEEFPGAPETMIRRMNFVNTVVAYSEDWKVVVDSERNSWAWHNDEQANVSDAPEEMVRRCHNHINKMEEVEIGDALSEMDEETISRLEDLGYI